MKFTNFLTHENGSGSIMSMYVTVSMLLLGGLAVDTSNAWREKNILQGAADAAAFSASTALPDQEEAVRRALLVSTENLGSSGNAQAIREEDIVFGSWDAEDGAFSNGEGATINAVRVNASRLNTRGNQLRTLVMRMIGIDNWDIVTSATVLAAATGSAAADSNCGNGMIISSNFIDTGGGNTLTDEVCIHGSQGVRTGGNDFFGPGVYISAHSENSVNINHTRSGSQTAEQVRSEQDINPVMLGQLGTKFNDLWSELAPLDGGTYSGNSLPPGIFNDQGVANVVHKKTGWWTIQPNQIQPNTIYLVDGGAQFAGTVDASNIAIISKGQIGVGGGNGLKFQDVFFFAKGALNFSGNVQWGGAGDYCDTGAFNTYLLSQQSLSLGGSGHVYGVYGAAPRFSPGGAMKAAGAIYFESSQYTSLGGAMNIAGCGTDLASHYGKAEYESTSVVPLSVAMTLVD